MKKNSVTFIDQPARNFIETALRESVFVEASAGTGKTYELEQRVTNLFCDPVLDLDPSRMAVITFTKAAASELKYRIRHALEKKLRTLPDPEKERLASKISRLERAGISTIHSFCLELLREMPVEFGIDPDVEILGEEESELLFSEVLSDVLREFDSRPLGALIRKYRVHRKVVEKLLRMLYEYRDLKPGRIEMEPVEESAVREALMEYRGIAKELVGNSGDPSDKLHLILQQNLKEIELLIAAPVEEIGKTLEAKRIQRAGNNGKAVNFPKADKARLGEAMEALEEAVAGFQEGVESARMGEVYHAALEAFHFFMTAYTERKSAKNRVDFSDCLMLLRDGLVRDRFLRERFQKKYQALLIDEFQDTDPLQAEIILLLAADSPEESNWHQVSVVPGKLFVVGDPKQSIYRFRRADIEIYHQVHSILLNSKKASAKTLSTNFRSGKKVIDYVNAAFETHLAPHPVEKNAGCEYSPLVVHPEREDGNHPGAVLRLRFDLDPESGRALNRARPELAAEYQTRKPMDLRAESDLKREAFALARFIQESVSKESILIRQKDGLPSRPAQYRDFLIIASRKKIFPHLEASLRHFGIPVALEGSKNFFRSPLCASILYLAKSVSGPADSHALAALLKSELFGLSDPELLSLKDEYGPSWKTLQASPHPQLKRLCRAREELRDLPVAVFLEELYDRFRILPLVRALGEEQESENLIKLKKLIETAASIHPGGLTPALDSLIAEIGEDSEETNLILDHENSDRLRIMTIHKSKGLESPIVILADPGKTTDRDSSILVDRSTGEVYAQVTLTQEDYQGAKMEMNRLTPGNSMIRSLMEREEVFSGEETKRLQYVAATRARDYFLVVDYAHKAIPAESFSTPLMPEGIEILEISLPVDEYREFRKNLGRSRTDIAPPVEEDSFDLDALRAQARAGLRGGLSGVTVSELVHAANPNFFQGVNRSTSRGTAFGTAVHEALEHLVREVRAMPDAPPPISSIARAAFERNESSLYQESDVRAVLERFFASTEMARLRQASAVLLEVPFIHHSTTHGRVHGVLDLLWKDEDGWHLWDYKTNQVDAVMTEARLDSYYEVQKRLYQEAFQELSGEKCVECRCLYVATSLPEAGVLP